MTPAPPPLRAVGMGARGSHVPDATSSSYTSSMNSGGWPVPAPWSSPPIRNSRPPDGDAGRRVPRRRRRRAGGPTVVARVEDLDPVRGNAAGRVAADHVELAAQLVTANSDRGCSSGASVDHAPPAGGAVDDGDG